MLSLLVPGACVALKKLAMTLAQCVITRSTQAVCSLGTEFPARFTCAGRMASLVETLDDAESFQRRGLAQFLDHWGRALAECWVILVFSFCLDSRCGCFILLAADVRSSPQPPLVTWAESWLSRAMRKINLFWLSRWLCQVHHYRDGKLENATDGSRQSKHLPKTSSLFSTDAWQILFRRISFASNSIGMKVDHRLFSKHFITICITDASSVHFNLYASMCPKNWLHLKIIKYEGLISSILRSRLVSDGHEK